MRTELGHRHPDDQQCWNGTCSKRLVFSMPRMWIVNYAATRVKQFHTRPTYRPGRSVDGFCVLDPHPRLRFSQYPSLDPRPYYPQAARANCPELLGFASPTPHGRYTKYRFITVHHGSRPTWMFIRRSGLFGPCQV